MFLTPSAITLMRKLSWLLYFVLLSVISLCVDVFVCVQVCLSQGAMVGIIRIYHECKGVIEKSVTRIIDWHQEACRVMTIGDQEGRIFLSHHHNFNVPERRDATLHADVTVT